MRFGKKGKLSPRYIGPYQIIRRVGHVVYELDLPANLPEVHLVFHVSLLQKRVRDPSRFVLIDDVQITELLTYEDVPVAILDRQVCRLRTKYIPLVKLLWQTNNVEEMIWKVEKDMRARYSHLYTTPGLGETLPKYLEIRRVEQILRSLVLN
uniref:Tf2-1-like SH3-like domain-containing protein n=1 Tax=Nicotiana tabacum TaxID=4097 RepID=A0A1S4AM31_TOBAC|nr:PREDICTED: uncharacterized protein LOC107799155 [Nicotiana tabacum]